MSELQFVCVTGFDPTKFDYRDRNEMILDLLDYMPEHQLKYWVHNTKFIEPQVKVHLMKLSGDDFKADVKAILAFYTAVKRQVLPPVQEEI